MTDLNPGFRTFWKAVTHEDREQVEDRRDAHLVGSRSAYDSRIHLPVLDIDFPAQLVPSSTRGHFHLYLDTHLTWDQYARLLAALYAADIIQEGFYQNSIKREQTFARLPEKPKHKERPGHPLFGTDSKDG